MSERNKKARASKKTSAEPAAVSKPQPPAAPPPEPESFNASNTEFLSPAAYRWIAAAVALLGAALLYVLLHGSEPIR